MQNILVKFVQPFSERDSSCFALAFRSTFVLEYSAAQLWVSKSKAKISQKSWNSA